MAHQHLQSRAIAEKPPASVQPLACRAGSPTQRPIPPSRALTDQSSHTQGPMPTRPRSPAPAISNLQNRGVNPRSVYSVCVWACGRICVYAVPHTLPVFVVRPAGVFFFFCRSVTYLLGNTPILICARSLRFDSVGPVLITNHCAKRLAGKTNPRDWRLIKPAENGQLEPFPAANPVPLMNGSRLAGPPQHSGSSVTPPQRSAAEKPDSWARLLVRTDSKG